MVDSPHQNTRSLLDWLLKRYPDTPKSRAKQWIQAGRVRVGGVVRRKPQDLLDDPGGTLELLDWQSATLDCGSGWQIHPRVELVFLDDTLAILNKGAGLISVPAPGADLSALGILADFLAGHLKPRLRGARGRKLPPAYRNLVPLPVHRLDQYTTGLFCVALSPKSRAHLVEQVRSHSMRREYLAFAQGKAQQPKGTWRHWLQFNDEQLRQKVVAAQTANAREAITHYEVIDEYPLANAKGFVTKLRLRLETGLQHQIRAQAAHVGMPLIGDHAYNPHYRHTRQQTGPIPFSRQALHSERLTLEHPDRGERMSWKADLPADLHQLERALCSGRI